MKILVADDHALFRKGLVQAIAEEYPDAQFSEASTTSEALECLSRECFDLLVLDVFMPGRSGLEVLQDVRRYHPNLPVLVLSSAPEQQMALRVLKAGASGYLCKQAAAERLAEAISRVLAGGKYVSAALAERLASDLSTNARPAHETLSNRELQILHLLVAGRSIKEVAAELCLSPKTVSTFHTRVWQKLGVRSDVELVLYAQEHGLKADG